MMIRELRRIGGLFKHNFEMLRQSGAGADTLKRQERPLGLLTSAIEHFGMPGHGLVKKVRRKAVDRPNT